MTSNDDERGPGKAPFCGLREHRNFTRFDLDAPATIWRESATISGRVVNMSLGGALLSVIPGLTMHEAVTVTIHDSARGEGLWNDLPATVVRAGRQESAVRFDRHLLEQGIADTFPLFR